MGMVRRAAAILVLGVLLVACGRSNPTVTPVPTATPTVAPTATKAATPTLAAATPGRPGATPGGTPGGTPAANPAAVSGAYTNLTKLDSYHMEIVVTDIGNLIQFGLGNKLSYSIDYNKGDQKIVFDDGSGTKQEAYKVAGKYYTVTNGATTPVTSLPLQFTLPDLLYSSLTAPGAMTFTAAGNEQMNGRATTKYMGVGSLSKLATNPLLALALAGANGDITGPVWVDTSQEFLVAGDITVNVTSPRTGTTKLRMDVTQVNQVAPIKAPQ